MTKPKLTLNIRQPTAGGNENKAIKKAVKRKQAANETIEEAWARIESMKNSEADKRKLAEVKQAMARGELSREPNNAGKRFSKAEAKRLWQVLNKRKQAEKLRQMVEDTPDNYWLITDEERLEELLTLLKDEDEIVFDVETTGTDTWKDYIVGHVITAIKADVHAYIPTKHNEGKQLPHDYVTERLRPFYEDESLGKLAHNAKFDINMLARDGVTLRGLTWDTQEAMKLLNENERAAGRSYQLKKLASFYLKDPSSTYGELFGNKGFNEVKLDEALAYAAKDGDLTLRLRNFQRHHLSKMPTILRYYETVEVPLVSVLAEMEREGYIIDLEYADEYGKSLKREIEELKEDLRKAFGDINMNSPVQLKKAIEEAIGKKIENTNANQTLKPLSKDYPIIKKLLEYRDRNKLYSTYINALPDLIEEETGRLHTNFNQNGARTGRFSSGKDKDDPNAASSFNIQNQPRDARGIYIAPPGWVIVSADFSAQEVRCIADLSKEDILVQAFRENKDAYATLASDYFGLPYEQCHKTPDGEDTEYRKKMKTVLLASIYGTSKYGLADQLSITTNEAQAFLNDFFNKYRKIKRWIEETKRFANKHGYVWIGDKFRKRRLPDARGNMRIYNPDRNKAMRQAPNARVQGLSAIQTKITLLEVHKESKKRGWRLWAQIHDEIIVLMPEDFTREDIKAFESIMINSYKFDTVANKTDIEIQKRWGDSMSVEEWFSK